MPTPRLRTVIITYFVFIAIWTIRIVLLKPYIDANLDLWARQLVNGVLKLTIWCGSALYLLRHHQMKITLKDMFCRNFSWRVLGVVSAFAILFHLIVMIVVNGKIHIHPFHPSQLISQFFIVGITEELLFRGWFYNALRSFTTPLKANIVSSIFFVSSHYPSYFMTGQDVASIVYLSVVIFLMGLLFGYLFEKTKNILVPTIFHSFWDLLQLLTIG